ncbi:hypothetical protein HPB49_009733 [Dermacentor silvarum]|uniref:Uncharacterized protein n=1 Tax=Dermacentor silvarum TaxID=543639 RepID=A0ACB8CWM8_DERSI|nr:hypothetical protein HPB49_009733 [Dermacentor silvarum]
MERMATSSEEMDSSAEELPATPTTSAIPNEQEDKTGWKVVISRKTKKKERAETTVPQQAQHTSGGQVSSSRTPPNVMNWVIRASRMPPLPQDNIKIVLRPKGGLNIQKVGPTSVSKALMAAVELNPEQTTEDYICPNITQNIMVASTPFRENAEKYADVRAIRIAGKEPIYVEDAGTQPLTLSIEEPHTCEDKQESFKVTGALRWKEQWRRRHGGRQSQRSYDDHAKGNRPTRTPGPPTDIETPQPVEIARQGEQREECPPPKKRAVTQPRMAVRSDVKDTMDAMSENMRLMHESMVRMNEKMDVFSTRVQKMEMYLNNTVVPSLERMSSQHVGAQGPPHDGFTASEGGYNSQHGNDK